MSDGVREQVFVVNPVMARISQHPAVRMDGVLNVSVETAITALEIPDITPAIDVLVELLKHNDRELVSICIGGLSELFMARGFDFFLSSNHAIELSRTLLELLHTTKAEHALFAELTECMTSFLKSPNQQLYIHDSELEFVISGLVREINSSGTGKKPVENILRRFLRYIVQLALSSVDEFIATDYCNSIRFLVQLTGEDLNDATAILVIEMIESMVLEAPEGLRKTPAHRQVLLVELPQLFIQFALSATRPVFDRMFTLYRRFIEIGDLALTSFSMIIGEMITPTIVQGGPNVFRALTMVGVFNERRPDLLRVFTVCDCSSDNTRRVFEDLFEAIAKLTMDNVQIPKFAIPALDLLQGSLSAFKRFFLSLDRKRGKKGGAKAKREILEQKMTVEGCAKVFNQSPKKGVIAIVSSGLAENNPQSLATFIRGCGLLDPVKISELVAGSPATELLSAYIGLWTFKGLGLDAALRDLCESFRIPGESQQIDRVMQAFATKYREDNPDGMSEDAAYVISFSIMMLHTDAYNPNVIKKMTKEEWITNTMRVSEACEVPVEVLQEIYSRVVSKPMELNEGTMSPTAEADALRQRSRKQLKKLMTRTEGQENPVMTREMYLLVIDRLWGPLFAAFSLCLQDASDMASVTRALECVKILVFFLARFAMKKELETVIPFLCVYSLTPGMEVAGLNALVDIAKSDGAGLYDMWLPILEVFSKAVKPYLPANGMRPINKDTKRAELCRIEGAPIAEINSVYQLAVNLSRFPFMSFMRSMCRVSTSEVFDNPPSFFTLEMIVNVCIHTVKHVRFVWSLAWDMIQANFCRIGCVPHEHVAVVGINRLHKVVVNISKNEEKWKHFQYEIIAPFQIMFANQPLKRPRQCIVKMLTEFIRTDVRIDVAWDVILDIFEAAAKDDDEQIVSSTYKILEEYVCNIPERFNAKLVIVMLNYAEQTVIGGIKGAAMACVTSIGMHIEPVQPRLVSMILTVLLETKDSDVIVFATKLVFMLFPKLTMDWATVELEYITPLFATSNNSLLMALMNELFDGFLADCSDKADRKSVV